MNNDSLLRQITGSTFDVEDMNIDQAKTALVKITKYLEQVGRLECDVENHITALEREENEVQN